MKERLAVGWRDKKQKRQSLLLCQGSTRQSKVEGKSGASKTADQAKGWVWRKQRNTGKKFVWHVLGKPNGKGVKLQKRTE